LEVLWQIVPNEKHDMTLSQIAASFQRQRQRDQSSWILGLAPALVHQRLGKTLVHDVTLGQILLAILLTWGSGCSQRADPECSEKPKEREVKALYQAPFDLEITPERPPRRDALVVKAKVTNVSNSPIGWDSLFSVFLSWELLMDDNETPLTPVIVERVQQTPESLAKTRFVLIEPGKSVSKVFELTKPFRRFRQGPAALRSFEPGADPGVGYEELVQYTARKWTKKLSVRWVYSRDSWSAGSARHLFGYDANDVKLSGRAVDSNTLVFKFKEKDAE
jgi:hypothetical protein